MSDTHEPADVAGDDPTTQREELEMDLMEEDASEVGEQIGDEIE